MNKQKNIELLDGLTTVATVRSADDRPDADGYQSVVISEFPLKSGMKLYPEEARMQLAHQIANAAACLDEIQSTTSSMADLQVALKAAPTHVVALQKIAHHLAGDRVNEIFAPEDSADVFTAEARENFLKKFGAEA